MPAAVKRPSVRITDCISEPVQGEISLNSAASAIPEKSRVEQCFTLGIFVLSAVYLLLFRSYVWIDPDEGIILQGAQRILDGQVAYRDFFSFYTPGSYYLLALIFRIFGNSLLVAHTALAVIGAAFSPFTYLLSRRVCSRQASLLVTGLMAITCLPLRFVVLHNWDSTLLACAGLYCALRWIETFNPGWAFSTGLFVSLTILFEQSKGAGLFLGIAVGILIVSVGPCRRSLLTRTQITVLALGLSLPFVITVTYFASQHALRLMLADWIWPLQHYSAANRVPFGYENLTPDAEQTIFGSGSLAVRALKILIFSPPLWLPVLPLFGLALLIRLSAKIVRKSTLPENWHYYVLVSASTGGLLLSIAAVRLDYEHFVYLHPIFFVVLAWLFDGRGIRSSFFARAVSPILGFCLSLSLLAMGAALLHRTKADYRVNTSHGTLATQTRDEVIEYVRARVIPGQPILIYPYESTYYYLTGTSSPTHFDYYQPGMHTRQQAGEILSDLSVRPVKLVLYDSSFADHARVSWPNTPANAFAYDPIADYIVREYRPCATLQSAVGWKFQFMVRNGQVCF